MTFRRWFLVGAALVLLALGAAAQSVPGTVLEAFPLDLKTPTGLAWDGEALWVADLQSATLNAVDPETGKVLRQVDAPGYLPLGLTWDGARLWVVDGADKTAYAWNPDTGITERALPLDTDTPEGIGWDGKDLWTLDARAGLLVRLDESDGTTFRSLPCPTSGGPRKGQEIGLAFDGKSLFVSDRVTDTIYRVDPATGAVLDDFPSPGPYPAGLAWDGEALWNVDFETRTLYRLSTGRTVPYVRRNPRSERVVYTDAYRNLGPGTLTRVVIVMAIPQDLPNQALKRPPVFTPAPADFPVDRWGQRCARWVFENVGPGEEVGARMEVEADLYQVRWFVDPERVGRLEEIPREIREAYTQNNSKLVLDHPVIQQAVKEALQGETNPYWMAWKINRYIQQKMHYELLGGWNVAPTVLSRGSGSCSEYTFVMLALCHAAGLPARYAGSVVVRGDDASRDDVFHRWVEVFLPNYGWFPVDPSGGDSPVPAESAAMFGGLENRFLITTLGAGDSELLGWDYNSAASWQARGRVKVLQRKDGLWSPAGKKVEPRSVGVAGGLTCEPGR